MQVLDPEIGLILPFQPWPHLYQLVWLFLNRRRLIVLKSRRVGVSWLFAAIALWLCLFHSASAVAIFSRREVDSIAMKNRAKFIWEHLPEWMQLPHGKDNDELFEFPLMYSRIQSFPATEDTGRSEGATLVIIDEWAFHRYARQNWAAIDPIAERSKLIGISTANGKDNQFSDLWFGAVAKENSFTPVFIPWTARSERTEEWWEQRKKDMGTLLALQEYPRYANDAFLVAGTCFFEVDLLHAMPLEKPARMFGEGKIWRRPYKHGSYVAGIDTAIGVRRGDFSCLQLLSKQDEPEQTAIIQSRSPLEDFSHQAFRLLKAYRFPQLVIEEQPQGLLVARIMRESGYPMGRIYHRAKKVPVFHTGERSRETMISDLAMTIRGGMLLHDENTVNELLGFGYDEEKHKFEATSGNDDTVMSLALANMLRAIKTFQASEGITLTKGVLKRKSPHYEDIDWGRVQ